MFWLFALEILKLLLFYISLQNAPGKSVTPKIVQVIFNLRAEWKTWKNIGLVVEQREDWARWIAKRYSKDTGLSLESRTQSGRRRKFGCNLDETIDLFACTLRSSTRKDISAALKEIISIDLSSRTIRRYLKNMGYRKVGAIHYTLTADHKEKRIDWCVQKQQELILQHNLFHDWRISDEVRVSLDGKNKPQVNMIRKDWLNDWSIDWLIDCLIYGCIDHYIDSLIDPIG